MKGFRYGAHAVIVLMTKVVWFSITGNHRLAVGSEYENTSKNTASCAMETPTTLLYS